MGIWKRKPKVEKPYPGHPSEFPDDPFERWMNRLSSGNIVQLFHEARSIELPQSEG